MSGKDYKSADARCSWSCVFFSCYWTFFLFVFHFWFISGKSEISTIILVVSCGLLPSERPAPKVRKERLLWQQQQWFCGSLTSKKRRWKGKGVCITLKSHLIVKKEKKHGINGGLMVKLVKNGLKEVKLESSIQTWSEATAASVCLATR